MNTPCVKLTDEGWMKTRSSGTRPSGCAGLLLLGGGDGVVEGYSSSWMYIAITFTYEANEELAPPPPPLPPSMPALAWVRTKNLSSRALLSTASAPPATCWLVCV